MTARDAEDRILADVRRLDEWVSGRLPKRTPSRIPPAVAEFAVEQYGTVHRVTEFTGRNPGLWIDGDDWGLTVRTTAGLDVELDSEVIVALSQAAVENEPIECCHSLCHRLADPDTGDDQTCTDHAPTRRWP